MTLVMSELRAFDALGNSIYSGCVALLARLTGPALAGHLVMAYLNRGKPAGIAVWAGRWLAVLSLVPSPVFSPWSGLAVLRAPGSREPQGMR